METSNAPKTYRLGSSEMVFTPNVIRMAIEQFAFDPTWATRLVAETWSIPTEAAEALVSKSVPYTVDGEAVVFSA